MKTCGLLLFLFAAYPLHAETLRVPLVSLPDSIIPAKILEVSGAVVANHLFEGLFCYDSSNKLSSNLIESFRISADGRKYTLRVKPGVKLANGAALTPEVIRDSLEDAIRTLGGTSKWAFGMMEGFDDFTSGKQPHLKGIVIAAKNILELRLRTPYSPMLQVFVSPYFKIAVKGADGYVGTGPYYIAERDPGKIVLKILPWRKKESDIDVIYFEKADSRKSMISPEGLKRYDVIEILSPWRIDTAEHSVIDFPYLQANLLLLNTQKDFFLEKAARKKFVGLLRRNIDFDLFGWQPTSVGFPFAKNLFKSEMAPVSGGNERFAVPIKVYYSDSAAVFDETAVKRLQDKLKQAGNDINFVKIPIKDLLDNFKKSDYDAALLGYVPDIIDPDGLFYPLLGSDQQYNFTNYSSKTADELLQRGRAELDTSKRFSIYTSLTNTIYADAPIGFLGATRGKMLVSKKYKAPQINSLGLFGFQLNTLRLNKRENGK